MEEKLITELTDLELAAAHQHWVTQCMISQEKLEQVTVELNRRIKAESEKRLLAQKDESQP